MMLELPTLSHEERLTMINIPLDTHNDRQKKLNILKFQKQNDLQL